MKKDKPINISKQEVNILLKKAEENQYGAESVLIGTLARLVLFLWKTIEEKKFSITRLKKMLFGSKSEKLKQNQDCQNSQDSQQSNSTIANTNNENNLAGSSSTSTESKKRKRRSGRLSSKHYTQAKIVNCTNEEVSVGSNCPNKLCKGRLYDTKKPQAFIKLDGAAIISATNYMRECLRCNSCQQRFTAKLPDGVKFEKYDITTDVALALHKYECCLPFYRISQIQKAIGVPIASSTQYARIESLADKIFPIYRELEKFAASSELLHQDDTTVRILSVMKENKNLPKKQRKSTYTTGIAARSDKNSVVLYYSAKRYSGENLFNLLKKRPLELKKALVVADAERRNWLDEYKDMVIKCLCLAHARRKFVDSEAAYPEKCKKVLDDLAQVYYNDSLTKGMTPEERLDYHKIHSQPIMNNLKEWVVKQLDENIEEETSSLGKALLYLRNHWFNLTQFLRIPQIPLDNNLLERLLRKAVIFRKNALFYKTEHSAIIGDIFLSIIGTCKLNNTNPFNYLVALGNNVSEVRKNPSKWLPWNYLQLQT